MNMMDVNVYVNVDNDEKNVNGKIILQDYEYDGNISLDAIKHILSLLSLINLNIYVINIY